MKNVWITLLLLLTVSGCLPDKIGKKDDPEPAPELAGTYQAAEVSDGSGLVLKPPVVLGTMRMTKSNDMYSLDVDVNINGNSYVKFTNETVSLRKASGKAHDIYQDNIRYGSVDGSEIRLELKATDNSPIIVVGRK